MNTKTIMIIGAAEEHCLGIKAAQNLGLKVFATDGNPTSPGFAIADACAVSSTYNEIATLAAARKFIADGGTIDGVMTLASDVPYTVAYVAQSLGLPNVGIESAKLASNKVRMKEKFKEHEVPAPLFYEVGHSKELDSLAGKVGMPAIVKPVDSRGARGVQLIRDKSGLVAAYAAAKESSPSGSVMIEQFLPGPQFSTEGFMVDGMPYIPAIFDRNYEYIGRFAPFIVENGGEMPSRNSDRLRAEIHEVMKSAALALGIKSGIIKGDLVLHDGRVKVIEIAARMSGGFFGTVATPVSSGVNLIECNIRASLGLRISGKDLMPRWQCGAAIRFAFPQVGVLRSIRGWDNVIEDSACVYAHNFLKPGDRIEPIINHPARPAVVVARGETRQEAAAAASRLIKMLQWEMA